MISVEAYRGWQSLTQMFFETADRLGDRPFLWAKRDGGFQPMSWREVADAAGKLSRGLRVHGIERGDRVAIVSREPARMADRRDRRAGRRRHRRAGLHHQHAGRSPAHPEQQRRQGGDRVAAEARRRAPAGRAQGGELQARRHGRAAQVQPDRGPGARHRLARASGRGRRPARRRARRGGEGQAHRHGRHHPHLGHRRHSARRHAESRRASWPTAWAPIICCRTIWSTTPRCCCRSCRCRIPTSTWPGQFLALSVGAQIYYAESVDHLVANMAEVQADDHDRRAAPLRGHARAHPARDGRHEGLPQAAVRQGAGARRQAL